MAPTRQEAISTLTLLFRRHQYQAIFFPSNETLYGYTDFGVWNISYDSVSCASQWSGSKDAAALGSVPSLEDGACCPADPTGSVNDTCPSFSDQNGEPPDTASSGAVTQQLRVPFVLAWMVTLLTLLMYLSPH